MKRILLLDIENCPQTAESLGQFCEEYHHVQLVYATSNLSFNLDVLSQMTTYIQHQRLHILKMNNVGKNSADFGLAFMAGRFSQLYASQAYQFVVMSNDHAMSYVVEMLIKFGFDAQLVKTRVHLPTVAAHLNQPDPVLLTPKLKQPPDLQNVLQKLMVILLKLEHLPVKQESLKKAIQSWVNIDAKHADKLMALMVAQQLITRDNQKVHYHLNVKNAHQAALSQSKTQQHLDADELPSTHDIIKHAHFRDIKLICDYLFKYETNRPTKTSTIQNMIKICLKYDKDSLIKNRYKLLIQCAVVLEKEHQKLQYNDKVIARWAKIILPEQPAAGELVSEPLKKNLAKTPRASTTVKTSAVKSSQTQALMLLATRLKQLDQNKPKYLAGFTELVKKLFPQSKAEDYVAQWLEDGVIGLDGRKIIYQIPLTMH